MTTPDGARRSIDDPDALPAAIDALRRSDPVIVPTDTVYGIAAIARDHVGVDALFELKARPAERSIAVLVANADQLADIAVAGAAERRLMAAFWPGGLTLVVTRRDDVVGIGADDGTVGVRCPDEEFVRRLATEVGPLATTSANLSGQPTPSEADTAAESLAGPVTVVIDGGTRGGAASTVARVTESAAGDVTVEVLRPGPISAAELEAVANSTG